jgi:hypothetical protein
VRYRVARTYGGRARQLELVGVRGAKRVLVDGGAQIWLRESVAGQRRATKDEAHRRVTSVRACDAHGQRLDTAEVWQDVGQKLDFYVDSPTPVVDIARAQLPEGYEVGTAGAGYVAILEGDQPEEVGPERANPWEAVVDAWRDCEEMREAEIGELQSALINARGRESQFVDNARACEETALRDALNEGLEPTRVTVAGGSTLDALGFTKQVTHSRCPDCNGTGVLAGFGFGTSANAVDRPCHCSPPKDEGPSEWTVVERDEALRDAYRCRQALQQILEIVRAVPPSGRALALDGSPEAVAAAVGHVLRCEAKR